jgi:hypothetical protein
MDLATATGRFHAPLPKAHRRTAVRNLERAGVPRSAAMKITGHLTETVYRRCAIVDEAMLREASEKLEALHAAEAFAGQPQNSHTSKQSVRR